MSKTFQQKCPKCGGIGHAHADAHRVVHLTHTASHGVSHAKSVASFGIAIVAGLGALFEVAKGCYFTCGACGHKFFSLSGK